MGDLFDLTNKTAIVTGGNGGIGLGIARGLASKGANLVIAARNKEKTKTAAEDIINDFNVQVLQLSVDVQDESSVRAMFHTIRDMFESMDILINNAGIGIRRAPQDYTLEEWELVLKINLTGAFLCSKEVYPYMVQAGGGKIINIGSMTSIFGSDWVSSYSASKGGVVQLSKSLALAWAKDNIQVNAILPGWIHTDLTAPIKTTTPDRYEFIKARIPHGRWGEPDDLAGTAVFLASNASNYVTGIALPVDGGYSAM
jgi:2-deoxy-D-gluconate 3-dehydrogenase